MSDNRIQPLGEQKQREEQPAKEQAPPVTTGDMQEVGALEPAEVPARKADDEGEEPVHENPGDQNSG